MSIHCKKIYKNSSDIKFGERVLFSVFFVNICCMNKIIFPTPNGIVVHQSDKKVISGVFKNGAKKLNSFKERNKIIFLEIPFIRGVQYFLFGILGFFNALLLSHQIFDRKQNKKDVKTIISLAIFALLGIFIGMILLGYAPGRLAWLIVGYKGEEILRNLLIAVLKVTFFVLFLLSFRIFPFFCEILRFNRASDISFFSGEKIKKRKSPARPLNFLNFLIFVFVLDFIVVSLVGANFGIVLNFLFHFGVFVAIVSVSYEILWLIENTKILRNLAYFTAFLVYLKPSTTHLETANIAMTEINLLATQKDRDFMDGENIAFAVVYTEVRERLSSAGINDKSDADWLIATVLGKNRAEIKLISSLSEKQYQEIMNATSRRAKGESLDNIFGFTEFYGLRFDVNKKVLTPRMETEILVENVIKYAKTKKSPSVLDLGTGSGAIAISVAKNCDAYVTAVDISKNALATAENNAKKNDVKIEFLHSNLFDGLKRKRKFDIIVSNPPYIKTGDIKNLDTNVKECDPMIALDGGEDGLDFYREIIPNSIRRLTQGGMLFFEIGKGQGPAVRKILRENDFEDIKTIKDYNKIERVIIARHK